MSADGSQTCVVPEGFRTSTRVVSSNVRQPAFWAKRRSDFENAKLADTQPTACTKLRRFIGKSLRLGVKIAISFSGAPTILTPDRPDGYREAKGWHGQIQFIRETFGRKS
jgi:hypothetical protein